jgi:uracil-DNA glycosylase
VGGYAQKYYLGARAKPSLTETVRAYEEYLPSMMPLVHPSPLNFRWQSKNPWFEAEVVPALRSLVTGALGATGSPGPAPTRTRPGP